MAKTLDDDKIRHLFEQGGWPCERITEDTWRSRFKGKNGRFPIHVRIDPAGFVTFAIVPYLKSPEPSDRASRLYGRLLELNHSLLMAKFSIDDDLDVVLSVEYPTGDLDPSEFRDALDSLTYYADQHCAELRNLAE